jgi:hypothetical protein
MSEALQYLHSRKKLPLNTSLNAMTISYSHRTGVFAALGAAILFGVGTPLAKALIRWPSAAGY